MCKVHSTLRIDDPYYTRDGPIGSKTRIAVLSVMGGKLSRDYNRTTGRYGYAYRPAHTMSTTLGQITQGTGEAAVVQEVNVNTRVREEDEVIHRIAPKDAPFASVVLGATANQSRFDACHAVGQQIRGLWVYIYERTYNTVTNKFDILPCPHAHLRFRLLIDHGS